MDYGRLLTRAIKVASTKNGLWLFALLGALGGIVFAILVNETMHRFGRSLTGLEWIDVTTGILSFFNLPRVILLSGGLLIAGILFWLMGAMAEIGLILGVWDVRVTGQIGIGGLFRRSMKLIGKMAVIDSILFLPLFVLLLALMLVAAGILFSAIILVSRSGGSTDDLSLIFGIGLVIFIPLTFALLLTLVVTPLVRIFSFRVGVLEDLNAWRSITRALALMKANLWDIIILTGLIFAFSSLVTFPVRTFGYLMTGADLGLAILELEPNAFLDVGLIVVNIITILAGSLVSIFLYYYKSTIWTLIYGEFIQ